MLVYEARWGKEAELRELRDTVKKVDHERKRPAVQFKEQEEDGKMEVEGLEEGVGAARTKKK